MPLNIAQRNAWSLARTLMVCVTLFHAGDKYGVMPSDEYDGQDEAIVQIYDPFAR